MKWATHELIHFDRVISAWLILRFVDPDAEFVFSGKNQPAGDDVILFGVPGVQLASHGEGTSTFARIIEAYSLRDPVLARLSAIVDEVVDHVMHDRDCAAIAARDPHVGGMLALAEGTMLLSASDSECLARSLPLYDALYARLQAGLLMARPAASQRSALTDAIQISNVTAVLRASAAKFSADAFADALRAVGARSHPS